MRNATCLRILILFIVFVGTIIFACACNTDASGTVTTDEGIISETTEQITPKPTKKPTPTPTPTPVSVYIPREELPDGQLFEEGYYAVLPGEGTYYNVYDSFGNQTDTRRIYGDEQTPPLYYAIGLFKETGRIDRSAVQTVVSEGEDGANYLYSSDHGFYQIVSQENGNKVYLYDLEGKYIRTLKFTVNSENEWPWVDVVVACIGDETVVSFSTDDWDSVAETMSYSNTIYFVALDGTINNKCEVQNLPNRPFALLDRKYYVVCQDVFEYMYGDIYDFAGNLVEKKVSMTSDNFVHLWSDEMSTNIMLCDYYVKDGKIFDSSLQEVEKNEWGDNGELIYGLEYDVQGIPCKAEYWKSGQPSTTVYFSNAELIAVGTQDHRIAIKTQSSEYVFDSNGASYKDMNNSILVLTKPDMSLQFISLETGKVICETAGYTDGVIMADEYSIVFVDESSGKPPIIYIIDNAGNIRYVTQKAGICPTLGEYIILYRGPYVGIADLNGDWIMKSLMWEMTRDEQYDYGY